MLKGKITTLFVLCIVFITASCSRSSGKEATESNAILNPVFLKNIKTTKAVLSNQQEELTLTGKVEYDPDKIINYVPLINGVVERTYFSLGDKVRKGQILLDIRSPELTQLQADLASLKAEEKIAERELKTAQSLFDSKMLSERELLEALARSNQCKASLRKTEMDMSLYGYNKDVGTFSVKAPMSGYIVHKNISSGSTIAGGGDIAFTIADLSNVWITANVYAGNLLFVKEGMEVNISTLSYPGEIFGGKISMLSQVFDPEERVLKARIIMPNKELTFKPEMSVIIKLHNETSRQLVAIPSDALIFDNEAYFVVVQKSPEDFEVKQVTIQSHNRNISYITSGVESGEDIVIKDQLLAYTGLKDKL